MNNQSRTRTYSIKSSHNSQQQQFFYNDFSHYNLRASSLTDFTDSVYSYASSNSKQAPTNMNSTLFTKEQLKFLTSYFDKHLIQPLKVQLDSSILNQVKKSQCVLATQASKYRTKIIQLEEDTRQAFTKLEKKLRKLKEGNEQNFQKVWKEFAQIKNNISQIRNDISQIRKEFSQIISEFSEVIKAMRQENIQFRRQIRLSIQHLEAKIDIFIFEQKQKTGNIFSRMEIGSQDALISTKELIQDNQVKIQLKNNSINQFIKIMDKYAKKWNQEIPKVLRDLQKGLLKTKLTQEKIQEDIQSMFNYLLRFNFSYNESTMRRLIFGFTFKDDYQLQIRNGDDLMQARNICSFSNDVPKLKKIIKKLFSELGYKKFIQKQFVRKQIKRVIKRVFMCEENLYSYGIILLISIVLIVFQNLRCYDEFAKLKQKIVSINEQNSTYVYLILDLLGKDKIVYS